MGILNITPNSFSDGGEYLDPEKALEHAFSMIEDGANIIDIGAESTRPGAKPADSNTEIERLTPVIKELRKNTDILISIDTRNSITARQMADFGADIINDVSGFTFDPDMAKTVAGTGLRAVINHSRGTPDTMDNFCNYEDLIDEIYNELYNMAQNAVEQGVQPDKIIIDPGFGFAKKVEQNFELLRRVKEFKSLGFPLLCGVSRKRFLQSLTGGQNTEGKPNTGKIDEISNMAAFYLASQNVDFIRVHDVKGAKIAVEMAQKMGF